MGISFTGDAPDISQSVYGNQYGNDSAVSGMQGQQRGQDSQAQSGTIGMLQNMAQGGGPNPAMAALNQATQQGQAFAQAQAGGARGNFGLAGAQHGAMQTAANVGQQAAQQGSVLQQNQQFQSIGALQTAQTQQRAQDLMATGMDQQTAISQAQIEAGQNIANQQTNAALLGGAVSATSSGLGMLGAAL